MSKYQNGKIYKIVCNINGDVYIGSTIQPLKKRLSGHREKRRGCCSKSIIDRGDYKIELIEDYPCDSRKELEKREGYWQSKIKCINIIKCITTDEDRKQRKKQQDKNYYLKNKDGKIKEYIEKNKETITKQNKIRCKKWYYENKEYTKQRGIEYREKNKDKIKLKKQLYYQKNKDKISQKYTCECGSVVAKRSKARHEKTKKHISFYSN